jgi:hypothetical protein
MVAAVVLALKSIKKHQRKKEKYAKLYNSGIALAQTPANSYEANRGKKDQKLFSLESWLLYNYT